MGDERVSAGAYAAREGLRKERLFFWKRKLRASAAMAVAGVSFAKVSVSPSRALPVGGPLEVVTRSGHTVRVAADFDEAALLRLLSVLGGA